MPPALTTSPTDGKSVDIDTVPRKRIMSLVTVGGSAGERGVSGVGRFKRILRGSLRDWFGTGRAGPFCSAML